MAKKNNEKIVSYDKEYDILFIHKGFAPDEKFKGNLDVGDFIFDISTKGNIRGIEILNASQNIKSQEPQHWLEHIIDADFNSQVKPNGIILSLIVKTKKKTQVPLTVAVPLQEPILRK